MTDEAADDNKKVIETNKEQRDEPRDEIVDEPDNEAAADETNVDQIVDEPDNDAADDRNKCQTMFSR